MNHSLVLLNAASSESFKNTSDQIKNLTPICRAAKNKKLMRLLQQRMIGNKSANFLGTKIQVYHRIAKRKKFNKLAVCLMNRELYNSIRDLGCHTWGTGIQYGMIRELRRMRGRRILSSRCLENLEDIPTEILICMIWKQLQLIPVTRKAAEEKLQQIVRCYMSLIWAVSIRKGLQTIHRMQRKKQECDMDENIKSSKLSGSVNWKWRILQQSNKLLSKFLLKNNIKNSLKATASQPILCQTPLSPESHGLLNERSSILEVESTQGKKTVDAVESKMKQDYNQVISEMKIKHASKQCLVGNKEDADNNTIPSKFQTAGTSYLDAIKKEPLNNNSWFPPENQPFGDQCDCNCTWNTSENESLQLLRPLINRQINRQQLYGHEKLETSFQTPPQNQTCGDYRNFDPLKFGVPPSQVRYKREDELFHLPGAKKINCEVNRQKIEQPKTSSRLLQNLTRGDNRNFDQFKLETPASKTRDKLENKSFHSPRPAEKDKYNFISAEQNTLKKGPQHGSYFRCRDENDSNQFTLPTGPSRGRSRNRLSLSTGKVEENTTQNNLMTKTKDSYNEKLSKYMQELNSSNEKVSREARENCKRLLLTKFEDDLPKLREMYAEKKKTSFPGQTAGSTDSTINKNQCYFPENPLQKFLHKHELQSSEGKEFHSHKTVKEYGSDNFDRPDLTSCCRNFQGEINVAENRANENSELHEKNYVKENSFLSASKKDYKTESTVKPLHERTKTENNVIPNLKHSQDFIEEHKKDEDTSCYQNFDFKNELPVEKNDYEETLRDLQKSISVHDVELRKLRFLNHVIDTNWEYFSPKHDKAANIIFDPDFSGSELGETNISGLPLDQVRSEIWEKILKEEENYLADTPCRDSEDAMGQKSGENEKKQTDFCQCDDVQSFNKQLQNLCLKDTLKINSCIDTTQRIDQIKNRNVTKNGNINDLTKNCEKLIKYSKPPGNVLIKDESDTTKSDHNKNFNNLEQNEFYTEQKLKSLKGQNSVTALEKVIKVERHIRPIKLAQDSKNSGRKLQKKQENCSRRRTSQEDEVRPKVKKELIRTPKKSYYLDRRSSKVISPKTEKEQLWQEKKTNRLHRGTNNLKSKRDNSNLSIVTNKDNSRSALHDDKKKTLNNKNKILSEKRTQVIYNNNNFVTKSHYNFLDSKRAGYHKTHVQLKNNSLAHGDAKKTFSETDNFKRKLREKRLNDKLNCLEMRLKKANRLNKLLAQLNNSSQVEKIQKYLEGKSLNLEKNEQTDLHHLILKKKKHLNKYLKLVNDFLVQLVSSETKKRHTESTSKSPKVTRNSDNFRSDCSGSLSEPKTRLSRSETVNATYYIENQTVIAHSHSTSGNYANKYKRVSAPSLPFISHAIDSRRASKINTDSKSKVTARKKTDPYWLIIFIAVAFLLYHSFGLISLLKCGNQTYSRGFRYR